MKLKPGINLNGFVILVDIFTTLYKSKRNTNVNFVKMTTFATAVEGSPHSYKVPPSS